MNSLHELVRLASSTDADSDDLLILGDAFEECGFPDWLVDLIRSGPLANDALVSLYIARKRKRELRSERNELYCTKWVDGPQNEWSMVSDCWRREPEDLHPDDWCNNCKATGKLTDEFQKASAVATGKLNSAMHYAKQIHDRAQKQPATE